MEIIGFFNKKIKNKLLKMFFEDIFSIRMVRNILYKRYFLWCEKMVKILNLKCQPKKS